MNAKVHISRAAVQSSVVLFAYSLISVVMTWPLAANLGGATLFGGRDENVFLWDFWWFRYSLQQLHTWPLHSDWIFYPIGTGLAFHTSTPLLSVLSIPFQNLWGLAAAYNLALLAAFIFSAFTMYLLVEYLTASRAAAFPAGLVFAFSTFKFYQSIGHLNIISTEFLPLYALFLIKMLREPSINPLSPGDERARVRASLRYAAFAGLSLAFVVLIDYYQFVYALFFTLCYLIYYLLGRESDVAAPLRRWRNRALLLPLLARLAIMALAFIVIAAPLLYAIYTDIRDGYYVRLEGDQYAADIAAFFVPGSPLFASLPWLQRLEKLVHSGGETMVYAGWVVIILVAYGSVRLMRRAADFRFWLTFLLLCFLFALGPKPLFFGSELPVPGPYALWAAVPLLNNARIPARFDLLVTFAAAVLVGYSLRELLANAKQRWPPLHPALLTATLLLLSALLLLEHLTIPLLTTGRLVVAPAYLAPVAATPGDFSVLELPAYGGDSTATAMYDQTFTQKRIFDAYISRPLPDFDTYYKNEAFISTLSTPRIGPEQANAAVTKALANPQAMDFYHLDAERVAYYLDVRYIIAAPKSLTPAGMLFLTSTLPLEQVYADNADLNQANVITYRVRTEALTAPPISSIELAQRGSHLFLLRGWSGGQSDVGAGFSYLTLTDAAAQLLTPVRTPADYSVTLTLSPTAGLHTLGLYANDESSPAATLTLDGGGWQQYRVIIDRSHWRIGLNRLWLRLSGGPSPDFRNITFTSAPAGQSAFP